jgi:hypothetical protein
LRRRRRVRAVFGHCVLSEAIGVIFGIAGIQGAELREGCPSLYSG